MQRPPIMRALTMPAGDFPYGNTIGLDSPFASSLFSLSFSLSSVVSSTFVREKEEIQAPFSLSFFLVSLDESLPLFRSSNVY